MSQYQDIFAQIFAATGEAEPDTLDRNVAYTLYPEYAGSIEPEASKQFQTGLGELLPWSKWLTTHKDEEAQSRVASDLKIPLKNSDLKVGRMISLSKQVMPPTGQLLRRHLRLEPLPEPQVFVGWAAYPVVKTSGKQGPDYGVKTIFVTDFPLQDSRPLTDGSNNRAMGYPTYHAYRFARADLNDGTELPSITVYLDGDKPEFHPDIMADEERGITARTIANIVACSGGGKDRYLTISDLENATSPISDGAEEGPSYGLAALQAALGFNMPIGYTGEVTHDSTGRIVLRPVGDLRSKLIATVTSTQDGFLSKVSGTADAMLVAVPGPVESGTIRARYSVGENTKDAFRFTSDLAFNPANTKAHPYCYLAVDLSGVLVAQLSHSAGAAQVIRNGAEEAAAEEDKMAALATQAKALNVINEYALDPSAFTGELATRFYQMDPAEQKAELERRKSRKVEVELSYLDDKTHMVKTKEYSVPLFDISWWTGAQNPFYQFVFAGAKTTKDGRVVTNVNWDRLPDLLRNSDEVRTNVARYFMGVPRQGRTKSGDLIDQLGVAIRKGRLKRLIGWLQGGASKRAAAQRAAMGLTASKNVSKLTKMKTQRARSLIDSLVAAPEDVPTYSPVTARSYKRVAKRPPPTAGPSGNKRKTPPRIAPPQPPPMAMDYPEEVPEELGDLEVMEGVEEEQAPDFSDFS